MTGRKEAFIYLLTKIVMGIIGVLSITVQTAYITPDVLGNFSLITGFTGVLVSVFIGWLGSSSLRYYDQYRKKDLKAFFTTVNINWLLMLLVVCSIIFVSSLFLKDIPIKQNLLLIVIMLIFSSGTEIYEKLMRASGHNFIYSLLLLSQSILNIVVIFIFLKLTPLQMEPLFIAKIIAGFVFVSVSLGILRVFKNISVRSYSSEINKAFFSYGFPMVGVWGVSWLLNYADRYVIKAFMTSSDVGLYDVPYRFSESSIGLIISAFNLAFFPAMIRCWNENGKEAICKMMRGIFKYFFMLAIPAFVGVALLSEQFYGTIIDEQYKEAAIVIAISSIGFVFMGVNNTLYKLWQLEEKTNAVLYLTILSVTVNLIGNVIFIPLYGYIAAAVTTVVSYVLATVVTVSLVRKKFPIPFDTKSFIKQVLASAVMGTFIFLFKEKVDSVLSLIVIIACAVIIYFISLICLGDLRGEIKAVLLKGKNDV